MCLSTTYSIFIQVHWKAGTLFFVNLILHIIEDYTSHCMPTGNMNIGVILD